LLFKYILFISFHT